MYLTCPIPLPVRPLEEFSGPLIFYDAGNVVVGDDDADDHVHALSGDVVAGARSSL